MRYSQRLLLFAIVLLLFDVTSAQLRCYGTGNYTSNSTYWVNLVDLLASMSSNMKIDYGFYNFTVGENADKVNAIALCRGDVKPDACRSCINSTSQTLLQACPNQKEAIQWSDKCSLRYSNRSIFGVMEMQPTVASYSSLKPPDIKGFNSVLSSQLNRLRESAILGNSTRKFALGSELTPDNQTIYALLQCTPDLDSLNCKSCLEQLIAFKSSCCNEQQGGKYVAPNCDLRYETYSFYDPAAEPPPPPPPSMAQPVSPPPLQMLPPTQDTPPTIPPLHHLVPAE